MRGLAGMAGPMTDNEKNSRSSKLSFAARLTLAFALVVVMTVLVALGMLSFVFDHDLRTDPLFAIIVAAAIALLLAICIGYLFARRMVRPLNRITSTARAIQEGDLSARTHLRGEDEISRLGEAFDAMAASIEKDRMLERLSLIHI